jgi:hypothetical protein
MSNQDHSPRPENEKQQLLFVVESAQRAGYSEAEIRKLVDSALADDQELNAAA